MPSILVLVVLFTTFASCNRKIQPEMSDNKPTPENVEVENVSQVEEVDIDSFAIAVEEEVTLILSLARTPCYGNCPVYSVKIYSDNSVVYHGSQNNDRIGFFKSDVSDQTIEVILDGAATIQFFNLSHKFPEEGRFIADIPNTVIGMNSGEEWHEIVINYGAPDELLSYIANLEDFFAALSWTSIPDPLNSPD